MSTTSTPPEKETDEKLGCMDKEKISMILWQSLPLSGLYWRKMLSSGSESSVKTWNLEECGKHTFQNKEAWLGEHDPSSFKAIQYSRERRRRRSCEDLAKHKTRCQRKVETQRVRWRTGKQWMEMDEWILWYLKSYKGDGLKKKKSGGEAETAQTAFSLQHNPFSLSHSHSKAVSYSLMYL